MKKLIKISALLFVFGLLETSVFAAPIVKDPNEPAKDVVAFSALKADAGVRITLQKEVAGTSLVNIYDKDNNLIFKDALPKKAATYAKGYVLTDLEDGNYTIEVATKTGVTKALVHVYLDENDKKSFFFLN